MSNSNSVLQGAYAPLPQTISDTDSEEEIHSAVVDKKLNIRNLQHSSNTHTINGKEMMKNYYPLDEGDNHNLNDFPGITTQDDMPIIKNPNTTGMSPIRRLLFVISILVCIFTVIIFVWLLPCDENYTCPAVVRKSYTSNWENNYLGIELKSTISVVPGVYGRSKNLIFLFRGDVVNSDPIKGFPNIPKNGGGIISIVGSTGKVAWFIPQNKIPTEIDCSIIVIESNNGNDCIIVGEHGLMQAVSPISGEIIWYAHTNSTKSIFTSIDFPLILPDLDNDGINDLATSCSIEKSDHNYLILISGKTGKVIGEPLQVSECNSIHNMAIDKNFLISYICQNNAFKESVINLTHLYHNITNRSMKTYQQYNNIKQHKSYGEKRDTESQRNIYFIHNRKLIVENQGRCPRFCNVTVQLIDTQSGRDNLTWSHTGTNMYGMVPATLVFNDTPKNRDALKGHISGFILKFWQWNQPVKYRHEKLSINNYSRRVLQNSPQNFTSKQKSWYSINNRSERNVPNVKNVNYTIHLLTERVVLITFNSTDIHIVNASQNEITQLCTVVNNVSICQPDLNFQENSILISDLDKDGSQELISYLSTFVNVEEQNEKDLDSVWQLQSVVKIVRLEAELPKLYEAVSKY